MADKKNIYIQTDASTSRSIKNYYDKRTRQVEASNRTKILEYQRSLQVEERNNKPLRVLSKFNVRSLRSNFSGSIVVRIFAIAFVIILLAYFLRKISMPPDQFVFPTLRSFLERIRDMPQLNLQGIINVPDIVTGIPFIDQVINYFNNLFNGIYNVLAFLISTFINILNISSYFFSWLFGISFFG